MTSSAGVAIKKWRWNRAPTTLLLPLLLALILRPEPSWATQNRIYSEGGSYSANDERPQRSTTSDAFAPPADYFDQPEYQQEPNLYRTDSSPAIEQERQRQRLASIVEQLRPEQGDQVLDELADEQNAAAADADQPMLNPEEPRQRNRNVEELEELGRLGMALRQMSQLPEGGAQQANKPQSSKNDKLSAVRFRRGAEALLTRGKLLRDLISKKCETDRRFEQLWEALVEEGSDLRELLDKKALNPGDAKVLVGQYKVYKQLVETAKKAVLLVDKLDKAKRRAERRQFLRVGGKAHDQLDQDRRGENTLLTLLEQGASGESEEGEKLHKRLWLNKLGRALDEKQKEFEGAGESEQEQPEPAVVQEDASKKIAAVKKGQSEFVEFVEPVQNSNNNRLKTVEWMEKRMPSDASYRERKAQGGGGPFRYFTNSGNLLFIAYLAICCMGIVASSVGGIYYYNHVRAARVDDPFNEFTRYSPSGPGKDKLKKNGTGGGPHGPFGQAGDDTLAYKAQLQHYQQQKQKILGAGPVVSGDDAMSDNEEDADELEHNYSVFECPGLAPTGDVEIQNPNFVGDNNEKKQPTKEPEQLMNRVD